MADSDTSPDSKAAYAAPALEKGFNVIELLATAPGGLTLSEIAVRLGYKSMSEIFRVVVVMERRGWLYKDPGTDRYTVTHHVLETVIRAIPSHDLMLVATPLMLELAQAIEQACHLVVLNGNKGLVITRQESPGPTGFAVKRGVEIDAVHTASGHTLMAFSHPDVVARVLKAHGGLKKDEARRIDKVRAQGYEMMPSIRTHGVTDMSCPLFGFDGYAVGALTVPFLELIDGTQKVPAAEALVILQDFARRISQGIGGRSSPA